VIRRESRQKGVSGQLRTPKDKGQRKQGNLSLQEKKQTALLKDEIEKMFRETSTRQKNRTANRTIKREKITRKHTSTTRDREEIVKTQMN